MGAPKQKWTQEEEAALRAGVDKYGPGKWRAILKDPTLSLSLALRSNVDLKMRQNYMISGNFPTVDERTPRSAHSGPPNKEAKHTPILLKDSSKKVIEEIRLKTKSEIDAELAKMRTMNAEEAAKAAAAAVAEAESAIAEAEQAAREAEAAEADAEAAQAFAEAAMMTLRNSKNSVSSLR